MQYAYQTLKNITEIRKSDLVKDIMKIIMESKRYFNIKRCSL